jgi:hypothetical protein
MQRFRSPAAQETAMWKAKSNETTPPDGPPRDPVDPVPRGDPAVDVPNPKPIDDPRVPRPGKTMRAAVS